MASTQFRTDSCSYKEQLKRSIGPGMYALNTPGNDCSGDDCNRDIPADPFLRFQTYGPGACPPGKAVDDGSELEGLNYKNSKCATDAYLPGKYSPSGICAPSGRSNPRSCMAPTESCRLSNPPCTLRATGWNRWEWLCWNPQDRALIPFEWNTSYRTVVKDNHTPLIDEPIDQTIFMPTEYMKEDNTFKFLHPPAPEAPGCAVAPGNPFGAYSISKNIIAQM
jgi:hypothetical protein